MSTLPPSLERAGAMENEENSAQYALNAIHAEVTQLSSKALCTATATEAAERVYLKRVKELGTIQAGTLGAERRIAQLQLQIDDVKKQIDDVNADTRLNFEEVQQKQLVYTSLTSSLEFHIYYWFIKIWN